MRSTFKILFYINRQKIKADGKTAILCRITIDGKSTAITTGEQCKSSEWNSRKGLTTDKKTNQRIGEFKELVEKTYQEILINGGVVSVELLKNRLLGVATIPTTLLTMSKAELQSVKECVGKSRAEGDLSESSLFRQVTYRVCKGYGNDGYNHNHYNGRLI